MASGWGRCGTWVLLAVITAAALTGVAYGVNPNEREVKPQINVLDPDVINKVGGKLWVFDFRFKDPRLVKVDIPGRGQKLCLYLWYQVINNSPEPQTFNPEFELVTQDRKNGTKRDQILPKAQEEISKIEDPTGYLKIKNSVTIAAEPIPPTRPNAMPVPVTGVAIWTIDLADKGPEKRHADDIDPDSNRYNIYVAGLSNGYSVSYPVGKEEKPVVLRKTLELRFRRLGDRYLMKSEEIKFLEPAQWMYRGSNLAVPESIKKPDDQ